MNAVVYLYSGYKGKVIHVLYQIWKPIYVHLSLTKVPVTDEDILFFWFTVGRIND